MFSNHDYFSLPSYILVLSINHGPLVLESAISFGSFRVEYPSMPTCNCETNGCRITIVLHIYYLGPFTVVTHLVDTSFSNHDYFGPSFVVIYIVHHRHLLFLHPCSLFV